MCQLYNSVSIQSFICPVSDLLYDWLNDQFLDKAGVPITVEYIV